MMRQLGGSFGIAVITTLIAQQNTVHRAALLPNYSPMNPQFMQKLQALQMNFMSRGMASNVAEKTAYQVMDYSLSKQAAVLSYMDIFLYLGVAFLICVPIMMLVKQKKGAAVDKEALAGAH